MIRFDNGAVLSVEASFSLNTKNDTGKIELFGTKAGAKIDPELELYSEINNYMTNVNLATPTALSFNGLFENEINHFVEFRRKHKTDKGSKCSFAEDSIIKKLVKVFWVLAFFVIIININK